MRKIREIKMWKKKPFVAATVVLGLLLLFLFIKLIMPCKEYHFEGGYAFETGVATSNTVIYDGISLTPGVYRIELAYETDTDLGAYCNVQDGTVYTGGLLCNGEHMYSALEKTEYEMWLYESTENLQVVLTFAGNGNLTTGNLKIVETNQLWTMLLTMVLFGAAVFYSVLAFYYYDKEHPVSKEKKQVFFFLAVISFIASLPYLYGCSYTGADLTYHLQRIEGVKDGLLSGQFPVRLEPKWVYNHGYADAIFYCNALLYFPAVLRILGFTVTASYNVYCIFLTIATVWISYYSFSRIFKNDTIGVICSALYTLSVFRIYKLVITTAVGEGSAVTFIPLVIYGLYRVFSEEPKEPKYKTAWVPIMLGYAGLIQTHVLTCEITALVTVIICLIYIRKIFCKDTFWELAKGAMGALLLSIWFLIPFLDYYVTQDVHIKHVSARTIQSSGLTLAHLLFHFWNNGAHTPADGSGVYHSHPVGIGLVLIIGLGLFLILWFSGAFQKMDDGFASFTKRISLIGIILLVMSLNVFPWDKIQDLHPVAASLVSSLQFPNRFLGWGSVCLILVFGFCLWYFCSKGSKAYWIMVAVALLGVTSSGMYLLDYVKMGQGYYELYNEESMGFGYISGGEYVIEGTDADKLSFAKPEVYGDVELLSYEKGCLQATLTCVNPSGEQGYVDVPLLLYKGYEAFCQETEEEIELTYGKNNVIRALIPAGFEGSLKIGFVSPIYWRIAEIISALTIAMLLVTGWKYRRKKDVKKEMQ